MRDLLHNLVVFAIATVPLLLKNEFVFWIWLNNSFRFITRDTRSALIRRLRVACNFFSNEILLVAYIIDKLIYWLSIIIDLIGTQEYHGIAALSYLSLTSLCLR